jgi:predicted AAA+ superfamily ATPase
LLETSCLLHRLPAYAVNRTKRLIKAPRLFLSDTGLACFLAGMRTTEDLKKNEMEGMFLENLVMNELLVWRETATPNPEILYWRTSAGQEVDFVIECSGKLTPIEVKASLKPKLADIAGLSAFFDEYPDNSRPGILIHLGSRTERLTSKIWAIPLHRILGC